MKKTAIVTTVLFLFLFPSGVFGSEPVVPKETTKFRITIIYDNYSVDRRLTADWGFSCLVEGGERTILFDTGRTPEVFFHNCEQLAVDLKQIDCVVLSHNHRDHTGNLFAILKIKSELEVFAPDTFPSRYIEKIENEGATARLVSEPLEICGGVFLTGPMGGAVREQSLLIDGRDGMAILSGCAHPGIVSVARRALEIVPGKIELVAGGFHLLNHPRAYIEKTVVRLKSLGVNVAAPCHCTGRWALTMVEEVFGKDYARAGAGSVFEFPRKNP